MAAILPRGRDRDRTGGNRNPGCDPEAPEAGRGPGREAGKPCGECATRTERALPESHRRCGQGGQDRRRFGSACVQAGCRSRAPGNPGGDHRRAAGTNLCFRCLREVVPIRMMEKSTAHRTVAAIVREQAGVAWSRAKQLCIDGRVTVDGVRCTDPAARVSPDAVVVVNETAPKLRAGALPPDSIVFFDRDVVVVDKPAGMLSVPDVPGNNETLVQHVRTLLRRKGGGDVPLAVVHRLDRDTSGVMAFARTVSAQRDLAAQFEGHEVERAYDAIVHGELASTRVETDLLLDRGDGLRGSFGHFRRVRGALPPDARHAVTTIEAIAALRGATLVECRLETGRQH